MAEKTKSISHVKHVPKDAQVIMSIMKDMGITDYEPKVINQLLEFTYRYITCILDDSKIYANHAKKKFIDLEDVRLAVKMQLDRTFTNPPPRDVLLDVAKSKNNIPLPFVKPNNGLRLPPDRYCLNSANYRLKNITKKQTGKMHTLVGNSLGGSSRLKVDANKPMSIVKRPGTTLSTIARTQTISIPKPVFKFTTVPKPIQRLSLPENSVYKFVVRIHPRSASSGSTSTAPKPKIPMGTTQGTPVIKMEVEESAKRKREDDDYDVP